MSASRKSQGSGTDLNTKLRTNHSGYHTQSYRNSDNGKINRTYEERYEIDLEDVEDLDRLDIEASWAVDKLESSVEIIYKENGDHYSSMEIRAQIPVLGEITFASLQGDDIDDWNALRKELEKQSI